MTKPNEMTISVLPERVATIRAKFLMTYYRATVFEIKLRDITKVGKLVCSKSLSGSQGPQYLVQTGLLRDVVT